MVQLRFDLNQLKSEIQEEIDEKIGGITKDDTLYKLLLQKYYSYVMTESPMSAPGPDTGAFMYASSGEARNGRFRQGKYTISRGHGIERDAIEYNHSGKGRSYFNAILGKMWGLHRDEVNARSIQESMEDYGIWDDFKEEAKEIILSRMKKG